MLSLLSSPDDNSLKSDEANSSSAKTSNLELQGSPVENKFVSSAVDWYGNVDVDVDVEDDDDGVGGGRPGRRSD